MPRSRRRRRRLGRRFEKQVLEALRASPAPVGPSGQPDGLLPGLVVEVKTAWSPEAEEQLRRYLATYPDRAGLLVVRWLPAGAPVRLVPHLSAARRMAPGELGVLVWGSRQRQRLARLARGAR